MSRARAVSAADVSSGSIKEDVATASGESSIKLVGECGYCSKAILHKERLLPLECLHCKNLYHVRCLRGPKPPVFLGDNLYKFTCAFCGSLGKESWERPNLQWVHVTHLALYNLILNGRGGRRGYFRWNEDICGFIRTNWNALMPHRKKTQSWHSTVAGTLSVHCPSVFQSGTALFGEHGWWSLNTMQPPSLKSALGGCLGKRSSSTSSSPALSGTPIQFGEEWLPPPTKKARSAGEHAKSRPSKPAVPKRSTPPFSLEPVPPLPLSTHSLPPPTPMEDADSALPSLLPLTERQEKVLESYLSQCPLAVAKDPKAARLLRKLKVRAKQRLYNRQLFDLDSSICHYLSATVKYIVEPMKEYSEQVSPVLRPVPSQSAYNTQQNQLVVSSRLAMPPNPQSQVLDKMSLIPILSRALPPEFKTFRQTLCGAGDVKSHITSPYTARKLPPFIFRTSELLPAKVRLNQEIRTRKLPQDSTQTDQQSIDFCYLQEHHLPAVNNLVSHFFWPVDLSECLQYPDFTCVVLYRKLVIGCAFMTPDVKVNEAYISFLVVHPDFQRCSIGKIMLYHLIQSCMGKDVTLHVSVDNPAMLLYQTMGFKAERYCLDFYRHYYPEAHHLSKNAYFMRLRK